MLTAWLLGIASPLITALLLLTAREIRRTSKTVSDSAAAVATLTTSVTRLDAHDAQNRERIAALWARVFLDPEWSHFEERPVV